MELKNEERQCCEVWTRVMGYHRPTDSFNHGKKQEFTDRQFFQERLSGAVAAMSETPQFTPMAMPIIGRMS